MTGQASDNFVYKDREYSITALEYPDEFFNIEDLGIYPGPMSTACWRGYIATFSIYYDEESLVLHYCRVGEFKRFQQMAPRSDEVTLRLREHLTARG